MGHCNSMWRTVGLVAVVVSIVQVSGVMADEAKPTAGAAGAACPVPAAVLALREPPRARSRRRDEVHLGEFAARELAPA